MELFNARDFKVFDIPGFQDRMQAISHRIRPKLASIGEDLAPAISALVDQPLYVHVARHARRTVNPPDDTWAALGADRRGYKKDVHFKAAVSRNAVRLLVEVGPEYWDKAEWALLWNREARALAEALGGGKKLGWFKDEHDEAPEALVAGWSADQIKELGRRLTGRRDGQLVLGRRIGEDELGGMDQSAFRKVALGTFKSLAPVFRLHEPRGVGAAR